MDNYGFTLNWDELPDDLQEQKIEEYMNYHNRVGSPDDIDDDKTTERDAEQDIRSHFPIYF